MKKLHIKIGVSAVTVLAAVGAIFLWSPALKSHAESDTTDVNLNINDVMSLSLNADSLVLNTTPGHFVSGTIQATASTNSPYGYTLTLEDADSNTALTHENTSVSNAFTSDYTGSLTSSEMYDNTWGFSLNSTDFFRIPSYGWPVALKRTTEIMPTAPETTDVTFGVKAGSIVAGAYSDSLIFTMYVNGQDGKPKETDDPAEPGSAECYGIHCIRSMQEMTADICAGSTTPDVSATALDWDGSHHGDPSYVPRTTLTDYRDFNVYIVSKLADGNCWMSQNLAFALDKTVALTSYRTDLTTKESWTPARSTMNNAILGWPQGATQAAQTTYSYRLARAERYYRGGTQKSSSPTRSTREYYWEDGGTYYNWYAATAGDGLANVPSGTFEDSICPKGWRLPPITGDKSFGHLVVDTYNATPTSALQAPLNFVLAGGFTFSNQTKDTQGTHAYYWTATGGRGITHVFKINTSIEADVQINSGNGESIRCVAR